MATARYLYEHCKELLNYEGPNPYAAVKPHCFYDKKGNNLDCFLITEKYITANYYVGVDWLIQGKEYVYVAPKINTKAICLFEDESKIEDFKVIHNNRKPKQIFDKNRDYKELNYLKMYLDAALHSEIAKHTQGILYVNWNAPAIKLEHKEQDLLTPFLIVQYLNLLKQIVRKGLKKSYYKVTHNLQGRIKGKILVGQNIKNNIVKNKLTNTICEYHVFGIDIIENRFLKKVLYFVSNYIASNSVLFHENQVTLKNMIAYCSPAFDGVSEDCKEDELKTLKTNDFFKEYKEAVDIGKHILKRFAYTISNTSDGQVTTTPPFWIDMPRLFELYVYHLLIKSNIHKSEKIKYQFGTYGNYLDFLIIDDEYSIIIDAKYKLQYKNSKVHQDMRQVAGYARLNKVLDDISKRNSNFKRDAILPCLIIYPDPDPNCNIDTSLKIEELIDDNKAIKAYHKIYKLGVWVPLINPHGIR